MLQSRAMFDATTLAAVAAELNEKILRGRVQEIVQLDALAFGFEIYAHHARHYFFVTAHPTDARAHLVAAKLRAGGLAPSPFLLALRKHAQDAFIHSIEQLPNERVLKIQFDHSSEGIATLVIETIGKYSNLILIDAGGDVIDALKRVSSNINRAREILPHRAYVPPPPQAKLDPATLTETALARVLAENSGAPLWQTLVKHIAGVSPLLAREIARRTITNYQLPIFLIETFAQLTRAPFHPTVAYEDDAPIAFAPYQLTQFANTRVFDSISAAIEEFFGAIESYAAAKGPLRAQIADARDKLARKRDALMQERVSDSEIERLRVSGEMILAYASQIKKGQTMLRAESEIGAIEIPLNPMLSAVENAQKFFKDYHRARDAAARVPALLDAAENQVGYAEQMLNDLELAEDRAEIDAVIALARAAGLITETRRVSKDPSGLNAPREFQSRDGFTILVGKNAQQNDTLTFRRARADDLWLHARNVAGAHVVIVRAGREIPESTLQHAAQLAKQYSQARADTRAEVIVAPRKNVHRVRGGKPGMVSVRNSAIVTIVQ
jgi:predicted ribosome quality control (RQC) complex YloA/Tae2 family protein